MEGSLNIEAGNEVVLYREPGMPVAPRRKPVARRLVKVHRDGTPVAAPTTGGVLQTKDGTGRKRFLVNIRLKGHPAVSRVFDTHKEAADWRAAKVAEIKAAITASATGTAKGTVPQGMVMRECFQLYLDNEAQKGVHLSRHLRRVVERLMKHPLLADVKVKDMGIAVISEYCLQRKNIDKVDPSTINQEYIRVNQAIKRCARWFGWGKYNPLDEDVRHELTKDGLIAQPKKRHRRPQGDEMPRLLAHFRAEEEAQRERLPYRLRKRGEAERRGEKLGRLIAIYPMADLCEFAKANCFRRGEIVSLRWKDLVTSASGAAIWCWRKDSTSEIKVGPHKGKRHCLVPLGKTAMEIIERQPRIEGEERIFPFAMGVITQKFSAACIKLGINVKRDHADRYSNLRFHDLRHEAISTLAAKKSMSNTDLQKVTGHKTMAALLGYVNHSQEDTHRISALID